MSHNPWIGYALVVVVLIMVLRRNLLGRRLRMEQLWILPAVLAALTVFYLAAERPPSLAVGAVLAAALGLGGAAGWQRGRFTRIALDPQTRSFTSQASPAALFLLAGLFVLRAALRAYIAQTSHDAALGLAVTDALVLFALGMVSVQRAEMWLRCRKMLANAEGA